MQVTKDGLTRPGVYFFEFMREAAQVTSDNLSLLMAAIDKATQILQVRSLPIPQPCSNKPQMAFDHMHGWREAGAMYAMHAMHACMPLMFFQALY